MRNVLNNICDYLKDGFEKPCWNTGWIFACFSFIIWFIRKIFPLRIFTFKKSPKERFFITDLYVFILLVHAIVLFSLIPKDISDGWRVFLLVMIALRLTELFFTWVGDFLISDPHLENSKRTLIIVLMGYLEIILWYSLLDFIITDGICRLQSFAYAVSTATVGPDKIPDTTIGVVLFTSQLIFDILFLSVVITQILNFPKQSNQ